MSARAARRWRVALGFLVAVGCGCGARTGVHDPLDASSGAPPAPPENACASAVSPAATTPMRGYCSTRAHFAPHAAPTAPADGWTTRLPTDFQAIEVLVDGAGRVYATIDPIRGDSALIPAMLVVVDSRGRLIAQHDFRPESVGNLFLATDGTLRATVGVSPRRLVRVDASGTVTSLATLPEHTFRFAVASDGTLIASIVDFRSPDVISRVATDGSVLWTSGPLDDGSCGGCISELALLSDDRVVVAAFAPDDRTLVRMLGADGAFLWERSVEGILTEGPAIAPDGSMRLVTGVTDASGTPTTFVNALSSTGELAWRTALAEDYQQTWDDALVIDGDGATFVRSFRALSAIDASGALRWRIDAPTNLTYDAVVDAHGTLVALLGPATALDTATGAELWHVDGPPPMSGTFYYLSNLALAPRGCLIGMSHGGTMFAACDR